MGVRCGVGCVCGVGFGFVFYGCFSIDENGMILLYVFSKKYTYPKKSVARLISCKYYHTFTSFSTH
jgi:hypothetical protein